METGRKKKSKVAGSYNVPQNVCVNDGFFVKPINEDYHIKIRYDDILWVEAISNYSHIHLFSGKTTSLSINIGRVDDILPPETFARVSRSEIINIFMVDKYCGNSVSIKGHSFMVSPSLRESVFSRFIELRREQ